MPASVQSIMKLDLPIIVRMGEKTLPAAEITALQPGSIIELPKTAEEPLELLVNNKCVGTGSAVKVGENFGIRIEHIGDLKSRIAAMGQEEEPTPFVSDPDDSEADASAEEMLAGQDSP